MSPKARWSHDLADPDYRGAGGLRMCLGVNPRPRSRRHRAALDDIGTCCSGMSNCCCASPKSIQVRRSGFRKSPGQRSSPKSSSSTADARKNGRHVKGSDGRTAEVNGDPFLTGAHSDRNNWSTTPSNKRPPKAGRSIDIQIGARPRNAGFRSVGERHGQGIPDDEKLRVIERCYRGDSAGETRVGGWSASSRKSPSLPGANADTGDNDPAMAPNRFKTA